MLRKWERRCMTTQVEVAKAGLEAAHGIFQFVREGAHTRNVLCARRLINSADELAGSHLHSKTLGV